MKKIAPILGTAMWGWTTHKSTAFDLLDDFYEKGFREIDGATNYPINKNPQDWRASEIILQEWIKAHGIEDLQIMMKVGSLNNLKSPDHNLSKSFLLLNLDEYQSKFGKNLHTFMIHWDNRSEKEAITETFEALQIAANQGLQTGFSGLKHPAIYAAINQDFQMDFRIQMKHNLLHSDYEKYHYFHGKQRFITYGINAGGIKLNPEEYNSGSSLKARDAAWSPPNPIIEKARKSIAFANQDTSRPAISTFNHLGMIYACYQSDVAGILLGTSTVKQLRDSLQFMHQIQAFSYQDVYDYLIA